jgi:hypothetical protein
MTKPDPIPDPIPDPKNDSSELSTVTNQEEITTHPNLLENSQSSSLTTLGTSNNPPEQTKATIDISSKQKYANQMKNLRNASDNAAQGKEEKKFFTNGKLQSCKSNGNNDDHDCFTEKTKVYYIYL